MYNNQKSRRTYSQEKNKGNYDKVIKQKFPLKFTDESYVNAYYSETKEKDN